jgi:hypothetical protein
MSGLSDVDRHYSAGATPAAPWRLSQLVVASAPLLIMLPPRVWLSGRAAPSRRDPQSARRQQEVPDPFCTWLNTDSHWLAASSGQLLLDVTQRTVRVSPEGRHWSTVIPGSVLVPVGS